MEQKKIDLIEKLKNLNMNSENGGPSKAAITEKTSILQALKSCQTSDMQKQTDIKQNRLIAALLKM